MQGRREFETNSLSKYVPPSSIRFWCDKHKLRSHSEPVTSLPLSLQDRLLAICIHMETSNQNNGTGGNHQNGVVPENGVAGPLEVAHGSGGAMEEDEEESREERNAGDPE